MFFFGLAKLVAWDPIEAVLILKNKQVSYVDDNLYDGGGIRLIFPIFGEELVCRAPLEIQTLDFRDANVMTREYLPLTIQGTMKWRIVSLQRFYLLVSQEISRVTDRGSTSPTEQQRNDSHQPTANRKIGSAEQWLRYMAEEQTRSAVTNVNTGLLIAERVMADLPPEIRDNVGKNTLESAVLTPKSSAKYRSATDGLAAAIHENVSPRVRDFGIEIHEVTLQEVRLPQNIHDAAVEACKSAYIPLVAQKEAIARKLQLQADVNVLGADVVGARDRKRPLR